MRFTFDDYKWYESYPSIQWYETVWSWLKSNSKLFELSGKRIHIGEDNETNEDSFGNTYIALYVSVGFQDEEFDSGDPLTGLG